MILEYIESVYGCSVLLKCDTCGKEFKRFKTTLKPKKTNNHFCCHECFDKFNVGKNNPSFGKEGLIREKNPRWNNGRRTTNGYIEILKPKHPYNKRGYVYEHRLVMEKVIGRYLRPEEQIHHINGNKKDNSFKNLLLFASASEHTNHHHQLLKKTS